VTGARNAKAATPPVARARRARPGVGAPAARRARPPGRQATAGGTRAPGPRGPSVARAARAPPRALREVEQPPVVDLTATDADAGTPRRCDDAGPDRAGPATPTPSFELEPSGPAAPLLEDEDIDEIGVTETEGPEAAEGPKRCVRRSRRGGAAGGAVARGARALTTLARVSCDGGRRRRGRAHGARSAAGRAAPAPPPAAIALTAPEGSSTGSGAEPPAESRHRPANRLEGARPTRS